MIALTAGKTIEVLLGGAAAAHQLEVVSSWTDVDPAASPQAVSPAANDLLTADGAPVTAVAAPAGTVARGVDHVSIFNADTAAAVVTVQVNSGSAVRRLTKATLQPGESLTYSGRMGWLTLDTQGGIKSSGQAVLLVGSPVVGGAAFAVLREDAGQLLAADAGLTFAGGQLTVSQGGVSTTLTQAGAATVLNDAVQVQLAVAGVPVVTATATQVQLANSYLVVTTTGLTIGTVPYVWPGASAAGVLSNNGAGILTWEAGAAPSGAAGGDLAGTYPDPTLAPSGVTAGTFGDGVHALTLTVGADGRLTAVSSSAATPDAVAVTYEASSAPSWAGTSPAVNVTDALDRCAAALSALGHAP